MYLYWVIFFFPVKTRFIILVAWLGLCEVCAYWNLFSENRNIYKTREWWSKLMVTSAFSSASLFSEIRKVYTLTTFSVLFSFWKILNLSDIVKPYIYIITLFLKLIHSPNLLLQLKCSKPVCVLIFVTHSVHKILTWITFFLHCSAIHSIAVDNFFS